MQINKMSVPLDKRIFVVWCVYSLLDEVQLANVPILENVHVLLAVEVQGRSVPREHDEVESSCTL